MAAHGRRPTQASGCRRAELGLPSVTAGYPLADGRESGVTLSKAAPDLWQDNFGCEAPFALGVEEELLLVGDDNKLINQASRLLREAEPDSGAVDGELFTAMVETRSEVSASAGEALEVLREVRRELLDSGARLMGAGLHPNAAPGDADLRQTPRYALIEDSLRGVLRTPICGQH